MKSADLDFSNLRLYGRDDEAHTLNEAYLRSSTSCQVVWITGYSGTGKTAFIDHVLKCDTKNYCCGKFERSQSTTPFSALISLLLNLCYVLENSPTITLSNEETSTLAKLIPEINDVVKPNLCQTQHKCKSPREWGLELLKHAMRSFIQKACQVLDSPLILFLDDLQWADTSSLDVIKDLLFDDANGLLFVGSYRDNEVDERHPLARCIKAVTQYKTEKATTKIHIKSLDTTSINRLVSDLLHLPPEKVRSLSDLVHQKADGNCFFTYHVMRHLYAKKMLYLSVYTEQWEWEVDRIRSEVHVSDNVIDFMSKKVQELPTTTINVLTLAAFIGNTIDVELLEKVYSSVYRSGETVSEEGTLVSDALQEAAKEYLIEWKSDRKRFNFSHDRVAAAVYELIPEGSQRMGLHLNIGRCIQRVFLRHQRYGEHKCTQWQEILAVDQLNRGSDLLHDIDERAELARLNLRAAELVIDSSAFRMAATFLHFGTTLLGDDRWETQYDLTLRLNNVLMSVMFANGALEEVLHVVEEISMHAEKPEDCYEAEHMHVYALGANNRVDEGINVGVQILRKMGYSQLPTRPSMASVVTAMFRVKRKLHGKSDSDLTSLPHCTDPKGLAIMKQLTLMMKSAMFADKENKTLLALACCHAIEMTFRSGLTAQCPFAFAMYGFIALKLGDFDEAFRFANLALNLMKQFYPIGLVLTVVHGFLIPLKRPLANCVDDTLYAYRVACSDGDMPVACLIADFHLMVRYYAGLPLESIVKDCFAFCSQMIKYQQRLMVKALLIFYRGALQMVGRLEEITKLVSDVESDEGFESFVRNGTGNGDNALLTAFWRRAMETGYLLRNLDYALKNGEKCLQSKALRGCCFVNSPLNTTVSALLSLHFWKEDRKNKGRHYNNFRKSHRQVLHWTKQGNPNCGQYVALLRAEELVVKRAPSDQIRFFYEKAIVMAKRSGHVHDAALASEHAARYYFGQKDTFWAQHYLSSALSLYDDWDATAKVHQLEHEFADLLLVEEDYCTSLHHPLSSSRSSKDDGDSSKRRRSSTSLTGRSREHIVTIAEEAHDDCRKAMEPNDDDIFSETILSDHVYPG